MSNCRLGLSLRLNPYRYGVANLWQQALE